MLVAEASAPKHLCEVCNSIADDYTVEDSNTGGLTTEDGDEASDNEDLNEMTSASGGEFPFISRQPEAPPPGGPPSLLQRSKTFASFRRTSLLPVTRDGNGPSTLDCSESWTSLSLQALQKV